MRPPIRPNVLQMTPYSPGKPIEEVKRELGLERVVKLASNENPLGPSPKALQAVRDAAERMHIYPDASGHDLRARIGAKFGLNPKQVMLGNGSDELIHILGNVFLEGDGVQIVIGYPSFVRYDAAALLAGTELVKVPLDSEWRHDLPAMAEAITPRTKLVFIANPNNPTGTVVRKPEFEAFLDKVPSEAVVVLDEAYGEFAEHLEDYPRAAEYVRQGRNVVGLRTFSKAHGLAGIRIGYGFASETICDAVDRAREPFNVNSLAHAAATAALDDKAHLQNTVEVNRDGIVRIKEAMAKYGHRCIESFANFICVDIGRPAQPAFEELLRRGVIVRSGVPLGMPTCLRITIGTPEEVGVFLEAMEDVEKAKV